MRDDGYENCSTVRVDMRERIIAGTVSSPEYMEAIASTVADLRAEGDSEGADELERMLVEARRRISAKDKAASRHGHMATSQDGAALA